MATVKKISGNYVIQTPLLNGSNITLDTDNVVVTGNLTIQGNTTTITSNNLTITDRVIVLNKGEPGAGVAGGTGNAAIVIDRGSLANVDLRWYEPTQKWQVTNDGANYYNILTAGGGGLTAIIDDPNPQLGGNLITRNRAIYGNTAVIFSGPTGAVLQLNIGNVQPSSVTDTTLLYANTAGGGASGLYTVQGTNNDELVTKTRAFGFSLIL